MLTGFLALPRKLGFIEKLTVDAVEYWDSSETTNSRGFKMKSIWVHAEDMTAQPVIQSLHSKNAAFCGPNFNLGLL